jgi:hypothetical protein
VLLKIYVHLSTLLEGGGDNLHSVDAAQKKTWNDVTFVACWYEHKRVLNFRYSAVMFQFM